MIAIFSAFGVKISKSIEIKHIPSVGDEVFFGLQRGVVHRRWWNLATQEVSVVLHMTQLDHGIWEDDSENWLALLSILPPNEWQWTGSFTDQLSQSWKRYQKSKL